MATFEELQARISAVQDLDVKKEFKKDKRQKQAENQFHSTLSKANKARAKKPRQKRKRAYSGKGYSYIYVDNEQVLEHRYLMEQKLQRKLLPHEAVYFRDGNRENMSIDNLRIGPNPKYRGEVKCSNCDCVIYDE